MSYPETIFLGYMPWWAYAVLFIVSFGANAAIVVAFRRLSKRGRTLNDLKAVQSMHTAPTPRVGGLAFVAGILSLYPLTLVMDVNAQNLVFYLTCLTPVVAAGLAEDVGHHIGPLGRMAAAVVSGALAVYFFGRVIDRAGIAPLDAALAIKPLAIAFTLFATAGITNAFNLIDGLNGLAALTAVGVTVSLSLVAHQVGQPELAQTVFLLTPLLLGYLALNYPFGKVFLGDAGAYLIGFTLAWMAVYIYNTDDVMSPYALLLIFFWPVADTLLAICRRARRGISAAQPDRLHFHQLVMRLLLLKTNLSKRIANPVSTILLLPMVLVPQVVGVLYWSNSAITLAVLGACSMAFLISYWALISVLRAHDTNLTCPIEASVQKR